MFQLGLAVFPSQGAGFDVAHGVPRDSQMLGCKLRRRDLGQVQREPLELACVPMLLFGKRNSHLPRNFTMIASYPRNLRFKVHLPAPNRGPQKQTHPASFSHHFFRPTPGTADHACQRLDVNHTRILGQLLAPDRSVAANPPHLIQQPIGHARSPGLKSSQLRTRTACPFLFKAGDAIPG